MGLADTYWPPNYTLIYFKLSYICPITWRFREGELESITLRRHTIEEIEAIEKPY